MTTDELRKLALAAITHEPSDHGKLSAVRMRVWQEALDDFHDEAHPERVLQLLACIEAAKAMRDVLLCSTATDHYCHYCQETIDPDKADAFDAVLAKLEQKLVFRLEP